MNRLNAVRDAVLVVAVACVAVPSVARAASAISVQPAVTELTAVPGQRWEGTIRVTNPTARPVRVRIATVNLAAPEIVGNPPVPLRDETVNERAASLAGWMSLPADRMVIAPRSTARLSVGVLIPDYAGPGLHRGGIMITQDGESGVNGARVAATIISGFAVRVHGQEFHDVAVSGFRTSRRFSFSFPVSLNFKIENRGATVAVMDGAVSVDRIPGSGRVHEPLRALAGGRYLIPGESLERSVNLDGRELGSMGLYRARISITGEDSGRTAYFVVVPWLVVFAVILALLAIIFGVRGVLLAAVRRARRKLSPGGISEHAV